MNTKTILFCLCLVSCLSVSFVSQGQNKHQLQIEGATAFSTGDALPFWLRSNQYGMYQDTSSFHKLMRISLARELDADKTFSVAYGLSAWAEHAEGSDLNLENLYMKLGWKNLILTVGKEREKEYMQGISSTNGNLLFSQNVRPMPGIKLELTDYITLPFSSNFIQFKGYWREGLLNDSRFVDKTRVHNKKIMFKWGRKESFYVETGLEHVVQWGGDSYTKGKLSRSFKDYLSVISGQEGTRMETINALGNHIGNYHLAFTFNRSKDHLQFFMQHPFEDRSGREFDNWPDGLYGVYWKSKDPKQLISHFIYEFYTTKNQSGPLHNDEEGHILSGNDNYFSNGTYPSGWTYFGQSIGSPFFKAQRKDLLLNGTNTAMENNRFIAHHIGLGGEYQNWTYKSLLSYSRNWGSFNLPYSSRKDQISFLLEANWTGKDGKWQIGGSLGIDKGDLYPDGVGARFSLIRNFDFL